MRKRPSERLFERYWASRGFPPPGREPRPGRGPNDKGPDYGVAFEGAQHLFEIKDLGPAGNPAVPAAGGPFEPCPTFRSLIGRAVSKFALYANHPCYAVLANAGRWRAPLEFTDDVIEAAFGPYRADGTLQVPLHVDGEHCEHPVPLPPGRRTNVRAVLVLDRRLLTSERIGAAVAAAWSRGDETEAARLLEDKKGFGPEEELPTLTVLANPFGLGVPEGLFRGRGDVCYGPRDGTYERLWAGPDAPLDE